MDEHDFTGIRTVIVDRPEDLLSRQGMDRRTMVRGSCKNRFKETVLKIGGQNGFNFSDDEENECEGGVTEIVLENDDGDGIIVL